MLTHTTAAAPAADPPGTTILSPAAFLKGAAVVSIGTGLAHLVAAASSPILTRIYNPADFGVFSVYFSLASIGATISALNLELAIPIAKSDRDGSCLRWASTNIALGLAICAAMLIGAWPQLLPGLTSTSSMRQYQWFLPPALLLSGQALAGAGWALRQSQFRRLGASKFTQNAGTALGQIVLGIVAPNPSSLLVGDIIGRCAGAACFFGRWQVPSDCSIRRMPHNLLSSIAHYRNFPILNAPASLLTALATQIPTLLLISLFGASVGGLFALTVRVLGIPVTLLSQSISQVYLSEASKLKTRPEAVAKMTHAIAVATLAIGFPIFTVIGFCAQPLFADIFGPAWGKAGIYAQILAPYYFIRLTAGALAHTFTVREWLGLKLFFSALECIVGGSAIFFSSRWHSDIYSVALFSITAFGLGCLALYRFLKAGYSGYTPVARAVLARRPILVLVGSVGTLLILAHWCNFAVSAIGFVSVYLLLLWRMWSPHCSLLGVTRTIPQ